MSSSDLQSTARNGIMSANTTLMPWPPDISANNSSSNNNSNETVEHDPLVTAYHVVGYFELAFSIIGPPIQLLVLYLGVAIYRRTGQQSQLMILSLTFGDLLVSSIHSPLMVGYFRFMINYPYGLCLTMYLFTYVGCIASSLSLLLLNIDKFMYLSRPLHYMNVVTVKRVRILICICWVVSCTWAVLIICGPATKFYAADEKGTEKCSVSPSHMSVYVSFFVVFMILPSLMSFAVSVYIQILVKRTRDRDRELEREMMWHQNHHNANANGDANGVVKNGTVKSKKKNIGKIKEKIKRAKTKRKDKNNAANNNNNSKNNNNVDSKTDNNDNKRKGSAMICKLRGTYKRQRSQSGITSPTEFEEVSISPKKSVKSKSLDAGAAASIHPGERSKSVAASVGASLRSAVFVFSCTIWTCFTIMPYRFGYIVNQINMRKDIYPDTPSVIALLTGFILLSLNPVGNPVVIILTQRLYLSHIRKHILPKLIPNRLWARFNGSNNGFQPCDTRFGGFYSESEAKTRSVTLGPVREGRPLDDSYANEGLNTNTKHSLLLSSEDSCTIQVTDDIEMNTISQ